MPKLKKFSSKPYKEKQEALRAFKRAMRRAKRLQEKNKKLKNQWIKDNTDFKKEDYLGKWRRLKKKAGEQFSDEIIKAMSVIDGVIQANDTAKIGMGMSGVEIDMDVVHDLQQNIFITRLAEILIKEANLGQEPAKEVLNRIIAQIFPIMEERKNPLLIKGDKGEAVIASRNTERRNYRTREGTPETQRQETPITNYPTIRKFRI